MGGRPPCPYACPEFFFFRPKSVSKTSTADCELVIQSNNRGLGMEKKKTKKTSPITASPFPPSGLFRLVSILPYPFIERRKKIFPLQNPRADSIITCTQIINVEPAGQSYPARARKRLVSACTRKFVPNIIKRFSISASLLFCQIFSLPDNVARGS